MTKDLKFIKSIIREEIKTWTGYDRELVDDLGKIEFVGEMSSEVLEFIENESFSIINKEEILEVLDLLMIDFGLNRL